MPGNGDGLHLLTRNEGRLAGLIGCICGCWNWGWDGIQDDAVDAAACFDEGEAEIGFKSEPDGVGVAFGEIEVGVEVAGDGGFIDDGCSESFFKDGGQGVEGGFDHGEPVVGGVVEAHASVLGGGGAEQGGGFGG